MPEIKSDRLVFDTNVVVTLFLKRDFEFIVDLKYLYQSRLYTCPEQIDELIRTLHSSRCQKYLSERVDFYVDFFKDFTENRTIEKRFDRAADPDDNYLFDLAYSVKSYYLVTGERALLNMKQVNKIQIVSLSAIKKLLNARII
jgi:putative PIN family toxin of toxin-antitoxin system